jgi:hypothetical protein
MGLVMYDDGRDPASRDRPGVKPFYYAIAGDRFVRFEIKRNAGDWAAGRPVVARFAPR